MKSDYVLHAVKGTKKSFDTAAENKILQYKDSRLYWFDETGEWTEIFTSTEGMSGVVELAENETPPLMSLQEGYSVSISNKRFGGAIEFTEDDRQKTKDSTVLIDKFVQRKRNKLLVATAHKFLSNIFAMYNEAFTSTSVYLAPDGVELCGTHTWKGGGTFVNKTTAKMSATAIDALRAYGGAFKDQAGVPMPIDFDTIIVKKGGAAALEAKKLFGMHGMKPTHVADINIYEGEFTIIETPYITNGNHWFAYDSKLEMPLYVGISKMPSLNAPLPQNNEAIRSNATGYWKQGVVEMPFNFYGSDGTV